MTASPPPACTFQEMYSELSSPMLVCSHPPHTSVGAAMPAHRTSTPGQPPKRTVARRTPPPAPFLSMPASASPRQALGCDGSMPTMRTAAASAADASTPAAPHQHDAQACSGTSSDGSDDAVGWARGRPTAVLTARPGPRGSDVTPFSLAPVRSSAEWPCGLHHHSTSTDHARHRSTSSPAPLPLRPTRSLSSSDPQHAHAQHARSLAPCPGLLAGRVQGSSSGGGSAGASSRALSRPASSVPTRLVAAPGSASAVRLGSQLPLHSKPLSTSQAASRPRSAQHAAPEHERVRYRLSPPPRAAVAAAATRSAHTLTTTSSLTLLSSSSRVQPAEGPLHAASPQGRYEAGMAAYHYYQTRQQQLGDTGVAAHAAPVPTESLDMTGASSCETRTTQSSLQVSSTEEDETHRDEQDPSHRTAGVANPLPPTAQTTSGAHTSYLSLHTNTDASQTQAEVPDTTAGPTVGEDGEEEGEESRKCKVTSRDEEAYLQRRRIRTFEATYHSRRQRPAETPLLDALLEQVAADYFQQRPPPLVVRSESASGADVQDAELGDAAREDAATPAEEAIRLTTSQPTTTTTAREGCIELSAWLERQQSQPPQEAPAAGAAHSDTSTLCPKDGRTASASTSPPPPPTWSGETADQASDMAQHTQRMHVHVERVLTALSRAHGRKLHTSNGPSTDRVPPPPLRTQPAERTVTTQPPQRSLSSSSSSSSSCVTPFADASEDETCANREPATATPRPRENAPPVPEFTGERRPAAKSRMPLPQRLAQSLRRHAPLMECAYRAARLMVYFLMRALPADLYAGDPADFAVLQRVELDGLTRLMRRIEGSTPHAALQTARLRIAEHHASMDDPRCLSSTSVMELCRSEWQDLSPGECIYLPALASTEAITWLLLPEGEHDLLPNSAGGGGGGGAAYKGTTRTAHTLQQNKALVRDDPVCRVLSLLLSSRAPACAALATVLEEDYVAASPSAMEGRVRLSCTSPLPGLSGTAGSARTQYWLLQQDVADVVQWLRTASRHGGHLDEPSREQALRVFYTTLGHVASRNPIRAGACSSLGGGHDLLRLIYAPCSFLTLAVAVLLHVSDAPPQVTEAEAEASEPPGTSSSASTAPPPAASCPTKRSVAGRPCCLHPQLVDSHGGYGCAPFTTEARQHMLHRRDVVCRLLDIAVTNTDGASSTRAVALHLNTTSECESDEENTAQSTRHLGTNNVDLAPLSLQPSSSFGTRITVASSPPCEADRQAHYAYLHAALQPSLTYLPLEAVHHVLSCSVVGNIKVPLEWAEEDVGPAGLELLLDLMHSFSQLSMSLSSNRKAALTDRALERKRQRHRDGRPHTAQHGSAKGARNHRRQATPPPPPTTTTATTTTATPESEPATLDAFFFEFHRQTLLKWCAMVCSEAATSYAMELAGPGLADFSFITYDTTSELQETQMDTVMSSPLARFALPSTLILPNSRHLAPLVLERCRRVVLEAITQLKGEMLFLLTGVDERDKLLAVHRATLLGVQRARDARRRVLWSQREQREIAKCHAAVAQSTNATSSCETTLPRDCPDGAFDAQMPQNWSGRSQNNNLTADHDEEEEASPPLWALDAARTSLALAAKKHAEHVLERTFLSCPLYARDGTYEAATLSDVVVLNPTRTTPTDAVLCATTDDAHLYDDDDDHHKSDDACDAEEEEVRSIGTRQTDSRPCTGTSERRTRASSQAARLSGGGANEAANAAGQPPRAAESPMDASLPDELRLETVYKLMFTMEEARLLSNHENTLFNGALINFQIEDHGFNPLGPRWRRAPPPSFAKNSDKAPLFPTNTVTRATVQRSAAARAAVAAKSIAKPNSRRASPSPSPREFSLPSPLPLTSLSQAGKEEEEGSARLAAEVSQEDAMTAAMRDFVTVPRSSSSWFEVGKENFETSRLAAQLRRPPAHRAFDLNSVSPLVALTTCVLPKPSATASGVAIPAMTVTMASAPPPVVTRGRVLHSAGAHRHTRPDTAHVDADADDHVLADVRDSLARPRSSGNTFGSGAAGAACQLDVPDQRLLTAATAAAAWATRRATEGEAAATGGTRPLRVSSTPPPPPVLQRPSLQPSSPTGMSTPYMDAIRCNPFLVRPPSSPGLGASSVSSFGGASLTAHSHATAPAVPCAAPHNRVSRAGLPPRHVAQRPSSATAFPSVVASRPNTATSTTSAAAPSLSVRPGTGTSSNASRRLARRQTSASRQRQRSAPGRIGTPGTAATAPVNTRAQATRVSMRERLGFRVGEHLMPWTS